MKRIYLILFQVVLVTGVMAQQKPHYTQYILNQYIVNPAITGIENYIDIKVSHRNQWSGFTDAPVTTYFSVHGPVGKKDFRTTATSFGMDGENPRGEAYWESYEAATPHHGVGVQVINDRTGPLSNFSAYLTYAYHLGLTSQTSLSAGFGAGFSKYSLDATKLDFGTTNPSDPSVAGNNSVLGKVRPDIMAGLYLYSGNYFVGVSAQQIMQQQIDFSGGAVTKPEGKTAPHIFTTAGFRMFLGDDLNFIPSVMVKFLQNQPTQIELNGKLQYRDFLWGGVSLRRQDGVAGMAGINISNAVNVGYSYDYATSVLNNYSRGTHEIIVGFILGNKYGDTCPRNVW